MPTNFELKRLKPKLHIVKKPENRVHELTDSNISRMRAQYMRAQYARRRAEQRSLARFHLALQDFI